MTLAMVMERVRDRALLKADRSGMPRYLRLQNALRSVIEDGLFGVHGALPPERDLAAELGVSRTTVRKAVQGLVADGLLEQRQGAGTFVVDRIEQPLGQLSGFTEDITARGLEPSVVWLDRALGSAAPDEAAALGLDPGVPIARLYRLRIASGKAMCLEQAILPQTILPDPMSVTESLYALLQERGLRPVRAQQRLRAELFDFEHARLLGLEPGTACLYMERQSYLPNGRPVEFVRSFYRGDSYDFVVELKT